MFISSCIRVAWTVFDFLIMLKIFRNSPNTARRNNHPFPSFFFYKLLKTQLILIQLLGFIPVSKKTWKPCTCLTQIFKNNEWQMSSMSHVAGPKKSKQKARQLRGKFLSLCAFAAENCWHNIKCPLVAPARNLTEISPRILIL